MKTGKIYGFMYQGKKDTSPKHRYLYVEEIDETSVLGKLMEENNFEAIRRFRFDCMTTNPVDVATFD